MTEPADDDRDPNPVSPSRPGEAPAGFPAFVKAWCKHQGLAVPQLHRDIAGWLGKRWRAKARPKRLLLLAFRGAGKSTLVGLFAAWLLARHPNLRILTLSADLALARKMVRNVKQLVENHPAMPPLKPKRPELWGADQFTIVRDAMLRDPSMLARGIDGNFTGSRADVVICDDVEVPGNSDTPAKRRTLRDKLGEIDFVLVPGGMQLYLGTPHSYYSIYAREPRPEAGEERPFLHGFERAEFAVVDGEGRPRWKERFSARAIEESRHATGPLKFASQMMLTPVALAGRRPLRSRQVAALFRLGRVSRGAWPPDPVAGGPPARLAAAILGSRLWPHGEQPQRDRRRVSGRPGRILAPSGPLFRPRSRPGGQPPGYRGRSRPALPGRRPVCARALGPGDHRGRQRHRQGDPGPVAQGLGRDQSRHRRGRAPFDPAQGHAHPRRLRSEPRRGAAPRPCRSLRRPVRARAGRVAARRQGRPARRRARRRCRRHSVRTGAACAASARTERPRRVASRRSAAAGDHDLRSLRDRTDSNLRHFRRDLPHFNRRRKMALKPIALVLALAGTSCIPLHPAAAAGPHPADGASAACAPYGELTQTLRQRFGETLRFRATENRGFALEFFAHGNGSWTLVMRQGDRACAIAAGTAWQPQPLPENAF
ncbi:MAG: phage terminase large subunit [Rhodospirillaceae bacterium]|nr:phage terminase large subunit [Rhodospirillaceae bacterium]